MSSSSHESDHSDVNRDAYEVMVRNHSFDMLKPSDWVLLIHGAYVGEYPTLREAMDHVDDQGKESYLAIQPNISKTRADNRWLVDVIKHRS